IDITEDSTHHRGPRLANDEVAALVCLDRVAFAVDDIGFDPEEGPCGRARLERRDEGGGDHMHAGLGLPPGINDWLVATDLAIPHPGLGVDRLADGAEEAE